MTDVENSCVIEPLAAHHDRAAFTCGVESLDRYLKEQASQDIKKHVGQTFVLRFQTTMVAILGYYTLATGSIDAPELPAVLQRRIPRYPAIPVMLLGRLAVDQRYQKQGYGGDLLMDAARRCLLISAQVGMWGMVVDAKDDGARRFYARYGFVSAVSQPLRLLLPLHTFAKWFAD